MDRRSIALGFLGYLCIGTAVVLIPSLMPSITAEFTARGWTLAAIGILVPAGAAGGICGTLLAGVGTDFLGHRRLIFFAAFALALALGLTASAFPWLLFVLGFVVVSVAQGALSTGINAMISNAGRGARARVLNLLHGIYGLGAAMSPLVIGWALERGVRWRLALTAIGVLWLTYAILVWLFARREAHATAESSARRLDFGMLRQPSFMALFLIAFIYNGVAVSLLTWVAVFAQESVGVSAYIAISLVSVFYVALTAGRFICAFVAEHMGYTLTLMVLACGVAIAYPLIVLGNNAALIVIGIFFLGLSLSGLFPTVLADGARRFPAQTGTVTGTLSIALTLGSLVPPLWTARLATYNLTLALGVNYVLAIVLLALARYLQTHDGHVGTRRALAEVAASSGSTQA